MLYMQEVETMDGYGEESYPAKVSMAPGLAEVRLGSWPENSQDTGDCRGVRQLETRVSLQAQKPRCSSPTALAVHASEQVFTCSSAPHTSHSALDWAAHVTLVAPGSDVLIMVSSWS